LNKTPGARAVGISAAFQTKLPKLRTDVFGRNPLVISATAPALQGIARQKTQRGANVSFEDRPRVLSERLSRFLRREWQRKKGDSDENKQRPREAATNHQDSCGNEMLKIGFCTKSQNGWLNARNVLVEQALPDSWNLDRTYKTFRIPNQQK
jgi:hypothetical protein